MTSRTHTPEDIEAIKQEFTARTFHQVVRNETLEEVALEIDKMKVFEADTMASIAAFIRDMKK
jgi:hypothetical protein